MRRRCLAALIAAAMLIISANRAAAVVITVDEFGHGILDFTAESAGVFFLTGVLKPDPGPGGLASVLTYDLLGPPSLVAGDVLLQEGGPAGPILDVLRFNPAGTGGPAYPASLLFYSDNLDGFDAPADTPSPPGAFYPNFRIIPESPIGDAFYTPGPGDPGFIAGFAVTYHFLSEGQIPEPSSVLLLVTGLAGLIARRKLSRN